MKGVRLPWIDWKLAPGSKVLETAGRFFLLLFLAALLSALLLSGGTDRFLSGQWPVTAILKGSVPPEEGEGISRKAAGLPGVRSAVYRDPDAAWKEFLAAYPGLEPLRGTSGNPLPGYVEIRMRPDRFTGAGIRSVEDALRPLPQVDSVLAGGEALPRLLRVKRWVNAFFWAGFALLCAVSFLIFVLQEKLRSSILSADFRFLMDRGIPGRRIAFSRAMGALATGLLISPAAVGAAAYLIFVLGTRLPLVERVMGPAEEIFTTPLLLPVAGYVLASGLFFGAASLLGWRAAGSRRG